jgi:hypothetical protein
VSSITQAKHFLSLGLSFLIYKASPQSKSSKSPSSATGEGGRVSAICHAESQAFLLFWGAFSLFFYFLFLVGLRFEPE